ncbi:MAG: DNA-binding protein [Candidatus Eisenbacteria bacterium RBG_16_71_46]|nr:MAG: DNA-binding protein [Candidatus Eisenbacteria bacterium RBG_16_71_46]
MPHDPELVAETREWLLRAERDLAAAAHDLTAEPPFLHDVVFHAQQAAEKTFKAFLTWHGRPFRKTHNLEELGQQCLGIEPELKAIVDRAVPLTDYAWKFRYPGDPEAPARDEAEGALAIARRLFEEIVVRLPADVRP